MSDQAVWPSRYVEVTQDAAQLAVTTRQLATRVGTLTRASQAAEWRMQEVALATKVRGGRRQQRDPRAGFEWMCRRAVLLRRDIQQQMGGFMQIGVLMQYPDGSGDRLIGWRFNEWWSETPFVLQLVTYRFGTIMPLDLCETTCQGTRFFRPAD